MNGSEYYEYSIRNPLSSPKVRERIYTHPANLNAKALRYAGTLGAFTFDESGICVDHSLGDFNYSTFVFPGEAFTRAISLGQLSDPGGKIVVEKVKPPKYRHLSLVDQHGEMAFWQAKPEESALMFPILETAPPQTTMLQIFPSLTDPDPVVINRVSRFTHSAAEYSAIHGYRDYASWVAWGAATTFINEWHRIKSGRPFWDLRNYERLLLTDQLGANYWRMSYQAARLSRVSLDLDGKPDPLLAAGFDFKLINLGHVLQDLTWGDTFGARVLTKDKPSQLAFIASFLYSTVRAGMITDDYLPRDHFGPNIDWQTIKRMAANLAMLEGAPTEYTDSYHAAKSLISLGSGRLFDAILEYTAPRVLGFSNLALDPNGHYRNYLHRVGSTAVNLSPHQLNLQSLKDYNARNGGQTVDRAAPKSNFSAVANALWRNRDEFFVLATRYGIDLNPLRLGMPQRLWDLQAVEVLDKLLEKLMKQEKRWGIFPKQRHLEDEYFLVKMYHDIRETPDMVRNTIFVDSKTVDNAIREVWDTRPDITMRLVFDDPSFRGSNISRYNLSEPATLRLVAQEIKYEGEYPTVSQLVDHWIATHQDKDLYPYGGLHLYYDVQISSGLYGREGIPVRHRVETRLLDEKHMHNLDNARSHHKAHWLNQDYSVVGEVTIIK